MINELSKEVKYPQLGEMHNSFWQEIVASITPSLSFTAKLINIPLGKETWMSQSLARRILSFDSYGNDQRTDEAFRGHHPVNHIGNVFYKRNLPLTPLDPLMEMAVFDFYVMAFGTGIAVSEMLIAKDVERLMFRLDTPYDVQLLKSVINGEQEKFIQEHPDFLPYMVVEKADHLLQASRAVDGIRLKEFIENSGEMAQLDDYTLSVHLLCSMLLNPGDHKPENFIIEQPAGKLVGIDNDWVFNHCNIISEGDEWANVQPFAGTKNVLPLLPEVMSRQVNPDVRSHFLNLDVRQFLESWLKGIEERNERMESVTPNLSPFIPLRFEKGAIRGLFQDMLALQEYLEKNPNATHESIFQTLRPRLAKYYQSVWQETKSSLAACRRLYGNERPYQKGPTSGKKIGIEALKGRWLFESLNRYKRRRTNQPQEALKELNEANDFSSVATESVWSSDCELLLKNCGDLEIRQKVAEDIVNAFISKNLPGEMADLFPYNFILAQLSRSLKDDEALFDVLREFCTRQSVYEDFVTFSYAGHQHDDLSSGIISAIDELKGGEHEN